MSDQVEQSAEEQNSGAADQSQAGEQNDDLSHESGEQQQENDDQQEEDEEVEIGERKYALPKSAAEKLKAERMMQADYTRKTQEVADQRKADEVARTEHQQRVEQTQKYLQDHAKLIAIDEQLAELNKVDLSQYVDSDPVGVQRVMLQRQQLEAARNTALQTVTQKQQQDALEQQQGIAKQVQDANAYFQREIPGWSEARSIELQNYAKDHGIDSTKLAKAILQDPSLVKALDKAEKFDRLEKQRSAKTPTPPPPAPVTRVGAARGNVAVDSAKMSDAEWLETERKKQRKR